jgi:ATP-dependent DNA ligase
VNRRFHAFLDVGRRKANAILHCLDLLWLNNEDLRNLPLVERKLRLRQLIGTSRKPEPSLRSHRMHDPGT